MKRMTLALAFLTPLLAGCFGPSYPSAEGNIFIKLRVLDLKAWKEGFRSLRAPMKDQGFTAYSLHQDLKDPHSLLVTLKCSDLKKGVRFVANRNLQDLPTAMGKQVLWAGTDSTGRVYIPGAGKEQAGIVIVRHEVKDFDFWLEGFKHASGGTHHHPDRGYVPSRRSVHRVPGKPEAVLVVHCASDVKKAPAFMGTQNMRDRMEAGGVLGTPEIWYGFDLAEGTF